MQRRIRAARRSLTAGDVMHICRLMVSDFVHGTGRFHPDMGPHELYDRGNLENGLAYAEDYLAVGITKCPVQDFDLTKFAAWCRGKLREDGAVKPGPGHAIGKGRS
jgi:hypothetical protein